MQTKARFRIKKGFKTTFTVITNSNNCLQAKTYPFCFKTLRFIFHTREGKCVKGVLQNMASAYVAFSKTELLRADLGI